MSMDPSMGMFNSPNNMNEPNRENFENELKEKIKDVNEPSVILKYIKDFLYGRGISDRTAEIDDALARISGRIFDKDPKNYAEMLLKTISGSMEKEDIVSLASHFVGDKETADRFKRYSNYDEISEFITFCGRALKVLTDSITSPDDVSKKTLYISSTDTVSFLNDEQVERIKSIINVLEIEDKMWGAVYETLKNGDYFVEILNYKDRSISINQSGLFEFEDKYGVNISKIDGLNENNNLSEYSSDEFLLEYSFSDREDETSSIKLKYEIYTETNEKDISKLENILREDKNVDVDAVIDKNNRGYSDKDIYDMEVEEVDIQHIRLIFHEPWKVIKIQSKRFRTCLGYLVLPDIDIEYGINSIGVGPGGYNSLYGKFYGGRNVKTIGSFISGVETVYKDILTRMKKYLNNNDVYISKNEVRGILEKLISETNSPSEDSMFLKIRYVPVDRMEHFMIPSVKYYPYGSSIFNKVLFLCKLLIALETAVILKRVSDSVDKRIIYVDSGIKRDSRDIIESIKEAFFKRKFFMGSTGTIGSIPSMLSNYELLMIPTVKGKRIVEFDTLSSTVRMEELSNELNFLRDSIISGLDVPPAYLNIEENLSNKTTLAFENILFAQTVISYQNIFSKNITSLLGKIVFMLTGKKLSKDIKVGFYPPKLLQMERDAEKYDIANRIISMLSDMGIPKELLIEKYIDIPKEDIEKYKTIGSIKDKISTDISQNQSQQDMGGNFPPMGNIGM